MKMLTARKIIAIFTAFSLAFFPAVPAGVAAPSQPVDATGVSTTSGPVVSVSADGTNTGTAAPAPAPATKSTTTDFLLNTGGISPRTSTTGTAEMSLVRDASGKATGYIKDGQEKSFVSYVTDQYRNVLGREPDGTSTSGGLGYWTGNLSSRVNKGDDLQASLNYIHDTAMAGSGEGQARLRRLGGTAAQVEQATILFIEATGGQMPGGNANEALNSRNDGSLRVAVGKLDATGNPVSGESRETIKNTINAWIAVHPAPETYSRENYYDATTYTVWSKNTYDNKGLLSSTQIVNYYSISYSYSFFRGRTMRRELTKTVTSTHNYDPATRKETLYEYKETMGNSTGVVIKNVNAADGSPIERYSKDSQGNISHKKYNAGRLIEDYQRNMVQTSYRSGWRTYYATTPVSTRTQYDPRTSKPAMKETMTGLQDTLTGREFYNADGVTVSQRDRFNGSGQLTHSDIYDQGRIVKTIDMNVLTGKKTQETLFRSDRSISGKNYFDAAETPVTRESYNEQSLRTSETILNTDGTTRLTTDYDPASQNITRVVDPLTGTYDVWGGEVTSTVNGTRTVWNNVRQAQTATPGDGRVAIVEGLWGNLSSHENAEGKLSIIWQGTTGTATWTSTDLSRVKTWEAVTVMSVGSSLAPGQAPLGVASFAGQFVSDVKTIPGDRTDYYDSNERKTGSISADGLTETIYRIDAASSVQTIYYFKAPITAPSVNLPDTALLTKKESFNADNRLTEQRDNEGVLTVTWPDGQSSGTATWTSTGTDGNRVKTWDNVTVLAPGAQATAEKMSLGALMNLEGKFVSDVERQIAAMGAGSETSFLNRDAQGNLRYTNVYDGAIQSGAPGALALKHVLVYTTGTNGVPILSQKTVYLAAFGQSLRYYDLQYNADEKISLITYYVYQDSVTNRAILAREVARASDALFTRSYTGYWLDPARTEADIGGPVGMIDDSKEGYNPLRLKDHMWYHKGTAADGTPYDEFYLDEKPPDIRQQFLTRAVVTIRSDGSTEIGYRNNPPQFMDGLNTTRIPYTDVFVDPIDVPLMRYSRVNALGEGTVTIFRSIPNDLALVGTIGYRKVVVSNFDAGNPTAGKFIFERFTTVGSRPGELITTYFVRDEPQPPSFPSVNTVAVGTLQMRSDCHITGDATTAQDAVTACD